MNQRLLRILNLSMAGLLALVFLWVLWLWIGTWGVLKGELEPFASVKKTVSPNPFVQSEDAYEAMVETLLALDRPPPQLTMPDLSKVLIYRGSNARPDADKESRAYYLELKGDTSPYRLEPETSFYLTFDAEQKPPRYVWSEGNRSTRLWIQVEGSDDQLMVGVYLRGLNGEQKREFVLKEQKRGPNRSEEWNLGGFRVDGTLLARQKARWYGVDLFFVDHGGEEYAHLMERQRIDFQDGEELYSCWLSPDECLMWNGRRWEEAPLTSGVSRDKPLLCVKNLGDKVMSLTLWDVDGSRKVALNLIRSNEIWQPKLLEKEFRFIGARTRTQSIVEIRGNRMTLRPYDWLLLLDGEWKKLTTEREIDDYVDRRTVGPLFVFEGLEKIDGVQSLRATLYNSSRTAKEELLLGAQQHKRGEAPERSSGVDRTSSRSSNAPQRINFELERKPSVPPVVPSGIRGTLPLQGEEVAPNTNRETQ